MMKRFTTGLLFTVCMCLMLTAEAQTQVFIGPTSGSSSYLYGPYYRSSSASTFDYSRYAYLYTASELNIPAGSVITEIAWLKEEGTISGNNTFSIWLRNSTATSLSSTDWTTLITGATQVYTSTTQSFMGPNNDYEAFALSATTPFVYTGGALEIITDHEMNGSASGANNYYYEQMSGMAIGWASGSAPSGTTVIGSSTSYSDRRPTIRITYASNAVNNAGISALTAPVNFCAGTEDIKVMVNNAGVNVIDSVRIAWTLDGVAQPDYLLTTPLDTISGSGPSQIEVTLGSYNFTGVPVAFKAWTYNPNGQADTSNANDTLTQTLQPALAGTFTIDAATPTGGTNYQSFGEFSSDLSSFGVCGPVVANVVAGTNVYNEFLSFGDIPGASAINTIRINGNGASVEFTNTSSDRQLLVLDGTKYLTIDSLNFTALDNTYGWAALITNGAAYDSIMNCVFDLTAITGTSSANSSGICFSSSATSATSSGANGSHCYIGHNQLLGTTGSGGFYYGITVNGASDSNVIAHNLVQNYYYYGIRLSDATGTKVLYNEVTRQTKTDVTTFYGIYTTLDVPGTEIIGNRIHDPYGGTSSASSSFYGIYLSGDGTPAQPLLCANNLIYNVTQGGTVYAIYMTSPNDVKVYHNTIDLSATLSSSSTNYGIYASSSATGAEVKNNIVNLTAGGTGNKYGFYYSTAGAIDDAQGNDFYVNSTQPGAQNYGYLSSPYATIAAFQSANPTFEVNSVSEDPQFAAPGTGDYTPGNYGLLGTTEDLTAVVPEDILGAVRPPVPTPGAFEFPASGPDNAGVIDLITPVGSFCSGQQEVSVSIMNAGSNNLTSLELHWEVNGVAQPTVTYSGTLTPLTATGQSIDTVVLGLADFVSGTPTNIHVWSALPNGVADSNPANDTLDVDSEAAQFVVQAVSDSVCINSEATMSLTPDDGYIDGAIVWQRSSDGTTWTDIPNTDTVDYAEVPNGVTWYRTQISGGQAPCYSDSVMVVVVDPVLLGVTDSSRCGPGTVTLLAQTGGNSVPVWYADEDGTTELGTGTPFETPYLTETDTFYVAAGGAGSGGGSGNSVGPLNPASVGGGGYTSSTTYVTYFTVNSGTTLVSVDIFPDNVGESGAIEIVDMANGTVVGTYPYTTTTAGSTTTGQTVTINQPLPAGDYSLGMTNTSVSLYRNTSGATFPYSIPELSITGTGFSTVTYYYYFYNWVVGAPCESPMQPVVATIHPVPEVDLGSDINECVDSGAAIVLDAGVQPDNPVFVWDDGSNSQIRPVDADGTYYVEVTNEFNCSASDTIAVVLRENPVVELGNDTTVCENSSLVLDAGDDGISYFWSNGATTSEIEATAEGEYSVLVTNAAGCTVSDTIEVIMDGLPPSIDGVMITNNGGDIFTFNALNPENIMGYDWDFGDGSPGSNQQSPTHSYDQPGDYVVTLTVTSNCGYDVDSNSVHIVGIGGINITDEELVVYPNPTRDQVTIVNKSDREMEHIAVYDIVGKKVYDRPADDPKKHRMNVDALSSGVYTIRIVTDQGAAIRKLEVIK